jgi:hypothetical protein
MRYLRHMFRHFDIVSKDCFAADGYILASIVGKKWMMPKWIFDVDLFFSHCLIANG